MKKIAILGSTGSIGTQTLSVIEEHADDFEVTALACGNCICLSGFHSSTETKLNQAVSAFSAF